MPNENEFVLLADPPWDVKFSRAGKSDHPDFQRLPQSSISKILTEQEASATVSVTFTLDIFLATELTRESPLPKWRLLIWDKKNPGAGWVVRRSHEPFILRYKEKWRPKRAIPSVLAFPRTDSRYATSKPVTLMVVLLEAIGLPVVDLFPGGGSAKTAAAILGLGYSTVEENRT